MSRIKYVFKNYLLFFLSEGRQVELCLISMNVYNNFKSSKLRFSLIGMAGYSLL